MSPVSSPQQSPTAALSPVQRRLIASQVRSGAAPVQNMAILTHFDGPIDAARLGEAFGAVVASSDVLRTVVEVHDLTLAAVTPFRDSGTTVLQMSREATRTWAADRSRAPLDLTQSSYDSVVIEHDDDTTSWFLNVHHLATDARSFARMIKATAEAYAGDEIHLPSYYEWFETAAANNASATAFWAEREPAPRLARLYGLRSGADVESRRVPITFTEASGARVQQRLGSDYRAISNELGATGLLLTLSLIHI